MASTVTDPVADVLVAKAEAITVTGYDIKGYKGPRVSIDKRPAIVVGMPPGIRRTAPTDPEPELRTSGQNSVGLWTLTFPVGFFIDATRVADNAILLAEIVEKFVMAVDTDPTLGGLEGVGHVGVPRCTDGEPDPDYLSLKKPLHAYVLDVEVPRLVLPS